MSELVNKKCFGNIEGKRTLINNNRLVEDNLGDMGIICLEDISNEILNLGDNFLNVTKFMWYYFIIKKYFLGLLN